MNTPKRGNGRSYILMCSNWRCSRSAPSGLNMKSSNSISLFSYISRCCSCFWALPIISDCLLTLFKFFLCCCWINLSRSCGLLGIATPKRSGILALVLLLAGAWLDRGLFIAVLLGWLCAILLKVARHRSAVCLRFLVHSNEKMCAGSETLLDRFHQNRFIRRLKWGNDTEL